MKQWEYTMLGYHEVGSISVINKEKEFLEFISRFGREGWEVVTVLPPEKVGSGFGFPILLKREIPESPEPPDVPKLTHVGENWTGWGKDESKCPKCGSEDTEELDASADEMTAGKRHCKSCGFEGETFLY